jgi:hypothetical protein
MENTDLLNGQESKLIEGKKCNLLFYYPLGHNELHGQIYNPINDDVIYENIIHDHIFIQLFFDFFNTIENTPNIKIETIQVISE